MNLVIDRALPVLKPSWVSFDAFEMPLDATVLSLSPGVHIIRTRVRRASELDEHQMSLPQAAKEPFEPPEWYPDAACASVDRETFFSEDRRARVTLANHAKALCRQCEFAPDCLTGALERREEFGIWAGTSGLKRKQMYARIDGGESTVADEVEAWLTRP